MRTVLIVAILAISTSPLYAQGQQPDAAKLKADAQKVVSIISGDKAKTQTFCQMEILGNQIDEAGAAVGTSALLRVKVGLCVSAFHAAASRVRSCGLPVCRPRLQDEA